MELLYFILTAFGLTQILVYGSIFDAARNKIGEISRWFGTLVNCPMCIGFWAGVFLFGINKYTELFNFEYNIANLLILGCVSSGTSYALNMIFGDAGIKVALFNPPTHYD